MATNGPLHPLAHNCVWHAFPYTLWELRFYGRMNQLCAETESDLIRVYATYNMALAWPGSASPTKWVKHFSDRAQ